jgi:hypothetical protein
LGGAGCEDLIDLGGHLQDLQDTRKDKTLQDTVGANPQNCQELLPPPSRGEQGGGSGSSRWGRRRSGRRGARARLGTGRGGRGELDEGAHRGRDEGRWPEFEVNAELRRLGAGWRGGLLRGRRGTRRRR